MPHTEKRKVTYVINDSEWLRDDMISHNPELTLKQIDDIMDAMSAPLIAKYTLIGKNQPDRYELEIDGEQCYINDKRLNNYHRGCILNDCWRHFMGQEHGKLDILHGYSKDVVFGCVEIIEEAIEE